MDRSIAAGVGHLEQGPAAGGMADGQDVEVPVPGQEDHRLEAGKVGVVDLPGEVQAATLEAEGGRSAQMRHRLQDHSGSAGRSSSGSSQ